MPTDALARRVRLQVEEARYRAEILERAHIELDLLREQQRARDRAGELVVPAGMWARYVRASMAADVAASFPYYSRAARLDRVLALAE